jgi:hypothetical protein
VLFKMMWSSRSTYQVQGSRVFHSCPPEPTYDKRCHSRLEQSRPESIFRYRDLRQTGGLIAAGKGGKKYRANSFPILVYPNLSATYNLHHLPSPTAPHSLPSPPQVRNALLTPDTLLKCYDRTPTLMRCASAAVIAEQLVIHMLKRLLNHASHVIQPARHLEARGLLRIPALSLRALVALRRVVIGLGTLVSVGFGALVALGLVVVGLGALVTFDLVAVGLGALVAGDVETDVAVERS